MAHGVRIFEHGAPGVMKYESLAVGEPGPSEVRLRQHAIGLNFVDTMFRDGTFPLDLPAVLGVEGTGVVEAVGSEVAGYRPGDRVAYFYAPGGYATERVLPAQALVRLPDDISDEQSAVFLAKGLTAWMGLRLLHQIKTGEIVLVQGASGAVGSILSHWASALGATVIGVAGSPEKLTAISRGTAHALLANDPDFARKLTDFAPAGVDVVYDFVGKATIPQSLASLRDGGKLLTIGAASGSANIDPAVIAERNIHVAGGSTPRDVRGELVGQAIGELFAAIRSGLFEQIKPRSYPLKAAAQAHEDIRTRHQSGPAFFLA